MRGRSMVWLAALAVLLLVVPVSAAEDDEAKTDFKWFGSLRFRPEYNDNLSDVFSGRDDKIGYVSYRINLGARVDLDKDVSVVLDGQAVGVWGEDQTPLRSGPSLDTTDAKFNFYRAFVEARDIMGTPFTFRAGRQPLAFGDEFLLGDLDFYGGTSWDSLRGDFASKLVDTTVFWGKGAELDAPEFMFGYPFGGDSNGDWDLYGAWTDWKIPGDNKLDVAMLYSLDRRYSDLIPFSDKRWTYYGYYHYGKGIGLFGTLNAAVQRGRTARNSDGEEAIDIKADAVEATVGWNFERGGGKYDIWGRWANFSGDDPTTADTNEAYDPMTMDFHGRYGYLDFWTGWWGYNTFLGDLGVQFAQVGFQSRLPNGIRITGLAQHVNRTSQTPAGATARNLGEEYGFVFGYDYGEHTSIDLGLAQLYPGRAFRDIAPQFASSTVRRFYVNTTVRF